MMKVASQDQWQDGGICGLSGVSVDCRGGGKGVSHICLRQYCFTLRQIKGGPLGVTFFLGGDQQSLVRAGRAVGESQGCELGAWELCVITASDVMCLEEELVCGKKKRFLFLKSKSSHLTQ